MHRPAAATVFGILNILFGGLSIVSAALSWGAIFLDSTSDNPVVSIMAASAFYSAWTKLTLFLGVIASVVAIASGIGLLKMERSARIVAVGYSLYSIFIVLAGGVLGWFFVYSPLLDQIRGAQEPSQQGALVGGLFGGLLGGCLGLIYPAALLYFMTRPGLVAAFEGTSVPEPTMAPPAPSPLVAAVEGGPVAEPRMTTPVPSPLVADSPPPVLDNWDPYTPPTAPLQTRSEARPDTGDDVLATIIPFRNKPALVSYYLGLFSLASLIPILGVIGVAMAVAAFVLGIKGRRLAKDHPEAKGTAHAWVGILGGGLWGFLGILMQAVVIFAIVAR